jgi:hypothetical protein
MKRKKNPAAVALGRFCLPCAYHAKASRRFAHAKCHTCGIDTCQHLIRFSTPRVVCGKCAARGAAR